MKRFLFLIILLCVGFAHAQTSEEVVKKTIDDFFDGFHKGDSTKLSLIKPRKDIYEERLLSYKVLVDGNMAHVWTPYEFYVNGQLSHCGVNSFQLFNDNGQWKITYIIDTRRRNDCKTKSE